MDDKKRADELELLVEAFLRDQEEFRQLADEVLRLSCKMHKYRRNLSALQSKK